ncbi:hypothetical protein [Actinoplanes cyaneus]|uniref:hypothetical protein n=1 Tax=Actinoplanes cyaneus TaxID=52696 RepID=UPI0019439A2C|nr:hypothetical protein [Actinoplanes cyaneus]
MPMLEPSLPLARVRVYTLAEVAELTGASLGQLRDDCRARRLTHFRRGRTIGMTLAHIEEFVAVHTILAAKIAAMSELEEVVMMSRRNARRGTRWRAA